MFLEKKIIVIRDMNKRVNFEDNIFILMMRIRMIQDTITLDADPELFLEMTLKDIDFVDHVLGILLGYIRDNQRLIEREELLEHLAELERQFSQALQKLLTHEGTISAREIPPVKEKLKLLWKGSQERREIAKTPDPSGGGGEPLVSPDELNELLKDF
jgi:hypothetical protein